MLDSPWSVCLLSCSSQMLYAFISALQTSFHYSLRELTTFCLWMVLCIHDSLVTKVSERTLHALCSLLGTFRAWRGQAGPSCKQGRQSLGNTPGWSGGPHLREELTVTGKSGVGRYPCPTRVQIQENAFNYKGSDRGITLAPQYPCSPYIPAHKHTHQSQSTVLTWSWRPHLQVQEWTCGLSLAKQRSTFSWLLWLV